jgi:geranylgeranylglycerol-phosphate geranylgeranyltransferase
MQAAAVKSIFSLLRMTRPANALIAVFTVAAGDFLAGAYPAPKVFVSECLALAFSIAFANLANDVLDVEADRVNRPERPLPSGSVTLGSARGAVLFTILAALVTGFLAGIPHGIFFIVLLAALALYDKTLKHYPLLKNVSVAILCATPLILPAIDGGKIHPALLPPFAFAVLLTFAREIFKDLEDIDGDGRAHIETLPMRIGPGNAVKLATFTTLLAIFAVPLPVLAQVYSPTFFLCAGLTFIPPLIAVILLARKAAFRKAQTLLKVSMLTGILSAILSLAISF